MVTTAQINKQLEQIDQRRFDQEQVLVDDNVALRMLTEMGRITPETIDGELRFKVLNEDLYFVKLGNYYWCGPTAAHKIIDNTLQYVSSYISSFGSQHAAEAAQLLQQIGMYRYTAKNNSDAFDALITSNGKNLFEHSGNNPGVSYLFRPRAVVVLMLSDFSRLQNDAWNMFNRTKINRPDFNRYGKVVYNRLEFLKICLGLIRENANVSTNVKPLQPFDSGSGKVSVKSTNVLPTLPKPPGKAKAVKTPVVRSSISSEVAEILKSYDEMIAKLEYQVQQGLIDVEAAEQILADARDSLDLLKSQLETVKKSRDMLTGI